MKIRRAQTDDLPILNDISISSKRYWGYPEAWIEIWKDDLSLSPEDFESMGIAVICKSSQIIGFCAVSKAKSQYEIEHLWILPEFIGQGYGRELLKKSIKMFVSGRKDILVTADPHAEAFYYKFGFRTIKSVESTPPGRFLPLMIKKLK